MHFFQFCICTLFLCYSSLLWGQTYAGIISYEKKQVWSENIGIILRNEDSLPDAELKVLKDQLRKQMFPDTVHLEIDLYFTPEVSLAFPRLLNKGGAVFEEPRYRSYSDFERMERVQTDLNAELEGHSNISMDAQPDRLRQVRRPQLKNYEALNKERDILGYPCQAYRQKFSSHTIWLYQGDKLPALNYQGFLRTDSPLQGTVLAYYSGDGKIAIEAKAIDFRQIDGQALRHAELFFLEEEDLFD